MEPIPAEAELSLRRSRVRKRTLIALSSLSEAYPAQLARAAGIDKSRVEWVMRGHLPRYRPELSLLALGLARERWSANGRVFEITARGRRKARSLTAAMRDGGRRRAQGG